MEFFPAKLFFLVFLLLVSFPIEAQQKSELVKPAFGWATFGIGIYNSGEVFEYGGNVGASYYSSLGHLSIRFVHMEDASMTVDEGFNTSKKISRLNEINVVPFCVQFGVLK